MQNGNIEEAKDLIEKNLTLTQKLIKQVHDFFPNLVIGLAVFVIGYIIARIIRYFLIKIECKSKLDKSVVGFISQVVYFFLILVTVMASLTAMGLDPSSWVAVLSALAVGIGLGIKDNLGNIASGLMILIFKPFKVSDYVSYNNEIAGTVMNINLVNTCLETIDMRRVYIPNSKMTSEYVINVNENSVKKLTISFTLSYESDHKLAMDILELLLKSHKDNLNYNETAVFIDKFSLYGVDIIGRCEVLTSRYWDMYYEINKKLKSEYDKHDIHFACIDKQLVKK
ncbi:MAG: mechanosensitive ion channel family protein [Peptostreptococcaceae bacterium]|nr:mechanosensitive ion channel family protein [uncultured Criibacterium sp.]MBS6062663.1 mechanosensitive ion channel family protein [Peptostreptococcaceae bacterium]